MIIVKTSLRTDRDTKPNQNLLKIKLCKQIKIPKQSSTIFLLTNKNKRQENHNNQEIQTTTEIQKPQNLIAKLEIHIKIQRKEPRISLT